MRFLRTSAAALLLAAATAACGGSSDTGSTGGWRVSGVHIRIAGASKACRTPSPVLDTFSATPTPDPSCSSAPKAGSNGSAAPSPAASAEVWQRPRTQYYHGGSTSWKPIYTTYTAPPGTGIYQPMVHATQQPMPTPFVTLTPSPMPTPTRMATLPPAPTQAPAYAAPTTTP